MCCFDVKYSFLDHQRAVPDVFRKYHVCLSVDDGNPVPAVFAKVDVLCEIDEANKLRAIQFCCVVDVIVIVENDLAVDDLKRLFSHDIGY